VTTTRALKAATILGLAFLFARSLDGCAESRCHLNSECAAGRCIDGECVRECFQPLDCPTDKPVCTSGICFPRDADSGLPDTGTDTSVSPDTTPPPTDTTVDPDTTIDPDTGTPPPDTGPGSKSYLDACSSDSECVSGICTPVAPRFCTKTCTSHLGCADGQICSGGKCRLDDTGKKGCDTTSGAPCLEFCFGTTTASHCTHSCTSVSECPAGFACSPVGSGKKVCVDIERPCSTATQCPSSVGYCGSGGVGCTAKCDFASDCPLRLVGLPAYTCATVSGTQVCVPPSDILGSDPIGASCSATGTVYCRSGGCDTTPSPPMCNQRCKPRGGCPPGFGCFPDAGGGSVSLVCTTVTGSGWLGETCGKARDCITGLCQAPGYCTRMCNDGFCPTGMTCKATGLSADDGTPISLCEK